MAESLESIEPLADLIDAYLRGGPDRYVDFLDFLHQSSSPRALADRATLITLSKLATAVELMRVEGLLSRGGPAPGPVPDDETSLTAALAPRIDGAIRQLADEMDTETLEALQDALSVVAEDEARSFRDRKLAPVAWQLAYEAWGLRRRDADNG